MSEEPFGQIVHMDMDVDPAGTVTRMTEWWSEVDLEKVPKAGEEWETPLWRWRWRITGKGRRPS